MKKYIRRSLLFFIKTIVFAFMWKSFCKQRSKTKEENQIMQTKKLKKILLYAVNNIEFYKKFKNVIDFKNFTQDEIYKLPIIDKAFINKNRNLFISKSYMWPVIKTKTSGSTGEPSEFLTSFKMFLIEDLLYKRLWNSTDRYKYSFMDPIIFLRSYLPGPNDKLYKHDFFNNIWYLSPFHINKENLKLYIDVIKKSRSRVLHGYPSSIFIFTQILKEYNIKIDQIDVISTSSETMLSSYRKTIEDWWGIEVLDCYGHAEQAVAIQQCQCGKYHNNDDYGYVEVINGEIIATSLNNFSMPLIRYKTGDIAIENTDVDYKCECKSTFSIPISSINGRSDDILIKKDGTCIPTVNIYTMMYKMDFIKQFQIIQKNNDKSVEVIVSGMVRDDDKNTIINNIQDRLGDVEVLVTVVEQIKRNQNTGKIKIIRRVD